MNVLNNYEGASITIIKNDVENNILYLSLKKENNSFSHYYNFIIDNTNNKDGTIYIRNIKNSPYYSEAFSNAPYIKIDKWEKLTSYQFNQNDELVINIKANTKQEISLLPRYVHENLIQFIEQQKNSNLTFTSNPIDEITIGDTSLPAIVLIARQHPGETLSSFFIEGVVQEILTSINLLKEYCFIIYPIVNKIGVKYGNHRYTNNIDYNRSWNKKNPPNEIAYIKSQLKKLNLKFFIDVHNDEITKVNYIRTSCECINDTIAGIKVLKIPSKIRRFARALIKQRKLINLFSKTANEYISQKYHCNTLLIELSMQENYSNINSIGQTFIKELFLKKL